jgi:hypothetical protein
LSHKISHFQELGCQRGVTLPRSVKFRYVPVDKAHLRRPLALNTQVLQITAHGDLPGAIVIIMRLRIAKTTNSKIETHS